MKKRAFNILIVEDEIVAVQYLKRILISLSYQTIFVSNNATDALEIINKHLIDLVFMDINIQGSVDGITCAHSLNIKQNIPIIYTTAYSDSVTIVEASETNIFGYLIKPFESAEVEALLRISLNRIRQSKTEELTQKVNSNHIINLSKSQCFNTQNSTFYDQGNPIDLTKKELLLLSVFCENFNNNVSFDKLKISVWKDKDISSSTIKNTILRLRKKTPNLNIQSIAGFGYILKSE